MYEMYMKLSNYILQRSCHLEVPPATSLPMLETVDISSFLFTFLLVVLADMQECFKFSFPWKTCSS